MKKIFVFFVFLITFPLFSEKIHFRLVKNQDKYDFIKNSEFYFDTQEDDISFYRDNYSFRDTSLNTTINGNRKSILINDIELFENNAIFPDSIKDSVWTLKNYLDDIRYNKNTLFINEPFWKKTWTQISVADYDEQGRDYFAPVTLKVFNACLCFDPNLVFDTTNVIFKSIKKETASYLIEGYVVDNYDTGYPFIYDYFPYKSKVIYELVLDGDYLYFCHHDKILLTFVRTKEEMQYEIINYYRNEKCDKSKFTWPRHADGTCDYEDVSSIKTVSTPTTNVSPNKTMTVSENLKLRSGEATSTQVLTVMQADTKVKILELGKSEIIDGINSNWVKVEVLSGAKDREGNTISRGTVGWCYGGYLAETTETNNFESTDIKEISDIKIEEAPKQEINIGIVCAIIGAVLLLLLLILIFAVRKKKDNP